MSSRMGKYTALASLCAGMMLMVLLSACSSAGPQRATGAEGLDTPAACQAAGGQLLALGRLQRLQCVRPYADAGRVCRDAADCAGDCLVQGEVQAGQAATGTCQRDVSQTFGCRQQVSNGLAGVMRCVD